MPLRWVVSCMWVFCAVLLSTGRAAATEADPIHYRPATGSLADTIPLYFQNQYHVFYLHAGVTGTPWEHIVSSDLIHWTELPTALVPDGDDPQGPNGGNMFTGSVIERQGTYHLFYTGHNPNNPNGMEFVCHATSPDGIAWTKHPEYTFGADGVHYQAKSDFRDPYVFWNESAQCFWMLLCAREAATGNPAQGLARSTDLVTWEQLDPLVFSPSLTGTPECPDLFKCGSTWYLLHSPSAGTTDVRWSKELSGPWQRPEPYSIDTSILYAAKRMTDGKRHVLTGWLRDLSGDTDNGGGLWGGTQCLPREAYEGPNGQLYFRPVDEVVAVYSNVYSETQTAVSPAVPFVMDAPDSYLLDCRVQLGAQSEFTVSFRLQDDGATAYYLTVRPAQGTAEIGGPGYSSSRSCFVDTTKPVKIQAFVQGSIIECFINEQYAFSRRAYLLTRGRLGLSVAGAGAEVKSLRIRTPSRIAIDPTLKGMPGVLTFRSNLTLAPSAVLYYDYTAQTADTVRVEGALTVQGHNTVNLTSANGDPPPRRMTLFTFGSLNGAEHVNGWGVQGEGLLDYRACLSYDAVGIYLRLVRDGTVLLVR